MLFGRAQTIGRGVLEKFISWGMQRGSEYHTAFIACRTYIFCIATNLRTADSTLPELNRSLSGEGLLSRRSNPV